MEETPLRTTTTERKPLFFITMIITFVVMSIIVCIILIYNLPYFKQVEINPSNHLEVYLMGEKTPYQAIEEEGILYFPLDFFKEHVDEGIRWEENGQFAVITTNTDVFHLPIGKKDGLLNLEPYSFSYPVIELDGLKYLPSTPIDEYYNIDILYIENTRIVSIRDKNNPFLQGEILNPTKLRQEPKLMSPWFYEVEQGKKVVIFKEEDGWYWVENEDGLMGYINKKEVKLGEIRAYDIKKEVYQPWNPIGEPIVLAWEYATTKTVNPESINGIQGMQVLSPTWFHLQEEGIVSNSADIRYVDWAHNNGFQIWGLFSNSFNPDLTHEVLSDPNLRIKVIKQLLSYVDLYKLDGINLDFENVHLKDKELLVQFVRELTPLLHEKDRTISIDVTFKSRSANWSMFYDRKKLGEIVDYVIVMAYDEHWATSPVSGSVASIPWVEKGIQGILEDVPNDKVILGVPFYTRLWIEEKDENGNVRVKSQTLTMKQIEKWLEEKKAEVVYHQDSGQRYAEIIENNTTYKLWIEDSYSMEKRIDIMKKYRLAGMAAWRRGFENQEFWNVISELIGKRP